MTTFERVKKVAKKRGYSLKQVAIKAGLSENAIYGWQYKKSPRADGVNNVAKVLDVSTDYLLGKTDEEPKEHDVDIDDLDTVMRYKGAEIPPEDVETIKNVLDGLRRARKEQDKK